MLKMSYSFLHNSRVCSRSSIFCILTKIKELSTTPLVETNQTKSKLNLQNPEASNNTPIPEKIPETFKTKSKIVAAAFASLHNKPIEDEIQINTPNTDQRVANATTVEQLLSISDGEGVSRRLALKIVSVLADWTANKKIKLSDFENDFRFVKLCRVLTKGNGRYERYSVSKSEDLSTVLSVTADDEAAKLVETITLPQMIKVMSTLASKKRRSTLLLRTLAYNISGSHEKLNLKLSSDLLYSMATLNFVDENLLSRVALDICTELENESGIKKSAVIGSIMTSLGLLKYKNPIVLDLLTNWVVKNLDLCRSQDVFSLFITLAILNYTPAEAGKLVEAVRPILTESEAGWPVNWLDHVWSKVLLNIATQEEISHVLGESFLNSLLKSNANDSISTKLKVLNIHGAVENLIKGYSGNKLSQTSPFRNGAMAPKRKEKVQMTESIVNSLKNLIQSDKYLKTNIDTGYGFCIDAECVLDSQCRPKELNVDRPEGTRIAILSLDYHDMTRGRVEPTGVNVFARKLLETNGYKVLAIPFSEFSPKNKLISRVQYLEKNLKELVKNI
ncbi:hypothetical protein HHI36_021307 [Cryptolaemus montrouzieri]|uniref:RAP domain-containing protein n=1 Tax=Cryptolaemus montrouzieri TaxID=559131 RepID=A0ABD2MWC8_9CUCU